MKQKSSSRLIFYALIVTTLAVCWQLFRDHYREEEREIRTELRKELVAHDPEQARQAALKYGLTPFAPGSGAATARHARPIVLIHGLDDPGKVWVNLAPVLSDQGFQVLIFTYPDDQPIEESARFLARKLAQLRLEGTAKVDIVAHSMGGLVSRELLSASRYELPHPIPGVRKLIMVGTPNHGSELARFRMLSEIRDQVAGFIQQGRIGWLDWVYDGAGEAGVDLIPGSPFLRTLNARPPLKDTELLVIAGVLGHADLEQLSGSLTRYENQLSATARQSLERLLTAIRSVLERVGDGLVTVESARLKDAKFLRVEGNHLSIIRNLLESSDRVPPAIPVILKELTSVDG
jgi:pimeloyl-ACP methyl ester carboxylesterase